MWGSKSTAGSSAEQRETASEENRPSSRTSYQRRYDHHEPNERTRLLSPRPPNPSGYLDPDDPAVSPYNLWSIRFLRYFTILFLIITCIWCLVLLISSFVSPPGMQSRGSGFTPLAFATLTLGTLLVAVVFFIAPAKGLRITTAIIAGLLLVDMILILSVPQLRLEEGWAGIASVVWAFLMAVWCIATDRIVAWGKREEEERLTGRPETRRTVKEWTAVMIATIFTVLFIIIGVLMTGTLSLRARDATLPIPGRRILVDGNKYAVHLSCVGNATYTNGTQDPTILLEAGSTPVEHGLEPWAASALNNGTISRYCYWDRPGYAYSDNAPSPHSAGMSADALSEVLAVSDEEGPWILVSAGYGSIVSRIFSSRHAKQVSGIMLVDPLHEDALSDLGSPGRGFTLWGWGVLSPLGLRRLAGAIFKGRNRMDRVYGRSAYLNGKVLKAKLQEALVASSLTRTEIVGARSIQSADLPLVLVSSERVNKSRKWEEWQRDLSGLTDRLVAWDVVDKAPHEVWRSWEGREAMESRVKELMQVARDGDDEPYGKA